MMEFTFIFWQRWYLFIYNAFKLGIQIFGPQKKKEKKRKTQTIHLVLILFLLSRTLGQCKYGFRYKRKQFSYIKDLFMYIIIFSSIEFSSTLYNFAPHVLSDTKLQSRKRIIGYLILSTISLDTMFEINRLCMIDVGIQ